MINQRNPEQRCWFASKGIGFFGKIGDELMKMSADKGNPEVEAFLRGPVTHGAVALDPATSA